MQFPVPQFIDVEDKIIGPFTLKQFGFVAGGGLIVLLFFKIFGLGIIFYILSLPVAAAALILAFASFNGRKLYNAVPVFFRFFFSDHAMVFQQKTPEDVYIKSLDETFKQAMQPKPQEAIVEPVQSKLRRLSLLLDQKNSEEYETLKIVNRQSGQR